MTSDGVHAVAWLAWALAGAVCAQLAGNPLYVGLLVGMSAVVVEVHAPPGPYRRAFGVLVGVGVFFGAMKVLLTVLTTHGMGGAIVTLPEVTLPRLLGGFTVGGTVEDVVLARSMSEALTIVAVMAVFGAFNAVVSHDELVRSLPRVFHEPGVVLTVGLAFVPATIASIRQAQESDLARSGGTPMHRGRLLRLSVPVLERGMESAVLLSESMESRGFARDHRVDRGTGALATAGLFVIATVIPVLVAGAEGLAMALLGAGVALLAAAVWLGSRNEGRTRHRPRGFGRDDWVVVTSALSAMVGLVALAVGHEGSLRWPGDPLVPPSLDPVVVAALGLLAVPAVLRPGGAER